jgi:Tfp pilus assembly protein PilZ
MYNPNNNRRYSREFFKKSLPLDVECKTMDTEFCASMLNLSPLGAFIKTDKHLSVGQEIAMTIRFPNGGETIKATAEIIRANYSGVGVEFKVFFSH